MVWKLYRSIFILVHRCAVIYAFNRDAHAQINEQLAKIDRLSRIIERVRFYYGLHPAYANDTHGSIEMYLKNQLSEQDWVFLTQLDIVKTKPIYPETTLKIA